MPSNSDDIFQGFSARKPRNLRITTPSPTTNPFRNPGTPVAASRTPTRVPAPPSTPSQSLAQAITLLTQVLSTVSAPTPVPKERDNVRSPNQFDGSSPTELRTFFTQLELAFKAQPQTFDSDEKWVTYALSYLKGTALQWFEPYLLEGPSDAPPVFMSDFSAFQDELWVNFGPYDASGDAEHELWDLRMANSNHIGAYITEFSRLATQVHWGTSTLRYQFYLRLPDRLKDHISLLGKPDSLYELRTLAQSLDCHYWERNSEQLRGPPSPTPSASGSISDRSDALSIISHPPTLTSEPSSPTLSISDLQEAGTLESRTSTPDLAVLDLLLEEPPEEASGEFPEALEDLISDSEL